MTNERVLLINAPNNLDYNKSGNYAVFPAIGIVSLGTRLQKDYPNLDISVIDGGVRTVDYIKKKTDEIRPSIVGISVITPTYKEGLELAKYCKEHYGSKMILGNDHASFFPEIILQKRGYIDYVVKAEFGEIPISYIIGREIGQETKETIIENGEEEIYFRTTSGIKKVAFPKILLSSVYQDSNDIPNLDLIVDDLIITKNNYNEKYGDKHKSERTPVVVNNVRGCGNGKKRCIYCGVYDLSLNTGNPNFFWKTIEEYNEKYGINFFFEACDSFLSFQKYIKQLISIMPFNPKKRDIEFEVYARANDMVNVSESINWFKQLNITRVNLGLDSGDDDVLKFLRKNNIDKRKVLSSSQINYEAVKRLAEAGITIHVSFPLGSFGETHKSLENTINFIEKISKDFGNSIVTLEASELVPLPNSPSWDILLFRENSIFNFNGGIESILKKAGIVIDEETKQILRDKYHNKDILDIDSLARDWVKYFTHIDWSEIEQSKESIDKIAKDIGAVCGRAF